MQNIDQQDVSRSGQTATAGTDFTKPRTRINFRPSGPEKAGNIAPSISVKSYNPWGGMTNGGLKKGITSTADAEKYLKYLDGTPYTHLPGLGLDFNDEPGPDPFRIKEVNGQLMLLDAPAHEKFHVLCQRNRYTPAISTNKAYRMLDTKMNFQQAKQACQNEGSVLAMPRTVEDINAIKGLFDRK